MSILKPVAFGVIAASGAILAKIALQNIIDNRRDEQQHYGAPCYNPQQTDMVKSSPKCYIMT